MCSLDQAWVYNAAMHHSASHGFIAILLGRKTKQPIRLFSPPQSFQMFQKDNLNATVKTDE